jgi:hypothetical protein
LGGKVDRPLLSGRFSRVNSLHGVSQWLQLQGSLFQLRQPLFQRRDPRLEFFDPVSQTWTAAG